MARCAFSSDHSRWRVRVSGQHPPVTGAHAQQGTLLELVQRQPEARDKGVEKVPDFRERQGVDAGAERLLCLRELRIPGPVLLQTLEVGTQLVRGGDQLPVHAVRLVRDQEALIIGLEDLGQHLVQGPGRCRLDRFIGRLNGRIEVFHRGWQIPRQHLTGIVIERQHGRALRIHRAGKHPIANEREGMGNHGHSQAVLLNVLRIRVVHQAPPLDEFHPGEVGEEMTHHVLHMVVFQICTLPLDLPCGGLLRKESERGLCLALPPLSHRPGQEAQ